MYQHASHWTYLMTFDIGSFYKNLCTNFKCFFLNSKMSGTLHKDLSTFILLTAVRNVLELGSSANGTIYCISKTNMKSFFHCWQHRADQQTYEGKVLFCLHDRTSCTNTLQRYGTCTTHVFWTLWRITTYIHRANLQKLHFKYLLNKYTYWIF
jgi:hypothetical protein